MTTATVEIDMIAGYCPTQGEGMVNGIPFYFRARGQRWSMAIGHDPTGRPSQLLWYREEPWGDTPYAAGWMPEDEARRIIERCAAEYLADAGGW